MKKSASPPKLLNYALFDWAYLVAIWITMALAPKVLYPILAFFVVGRLTTLGALIHDACHRDETSNDTSLRFLEVLAGYPVLTTLASTRYHHLRHHLNSGTEADPYFQFEKLPNWIRYTIWFPRGLLLFPVWTLRAFVGTVASFVPSIIPFYARAFLQDRQARVATAEMLHCAKAERPLTLFLMILAGFAIRFPGEIIYGYFIPVLLSGIFFGLRLMLEHSGGDGAPVDREIRGPMGTILYPRNSGYHRTHHLHPKVSFRDLPNMADKIH